MKKTTFLAVFAISAITTVAVTLPSSAKAVFSRTVQANSCLPTRGSTGIASDGAYLSNTGVSSGTIDCPIIDDTSLPATSATSVLVYMYDGSTTAHVFAHLCSIASGSSTATCGVGFGAPVATIGFATHGPGLSGLGSAGDFKYLHVTLPPPGVSTSFLQGYTISN